MYVCIIISRRFKKRTIFNQKSVLLPNVNQLSSFLDSIFIAFKSIFC